MTTATAPIQTALVPWTLDPTHTDIEFSVRHLMISNVKGRFSNPTGTVSFDPKKPGALELDVSIPIASIDTRNEQRDTHLRSADFFDAEQFPVMTFTAKGTDGAIGGDFKLIGDLTIRGVTREVTLDVVAEGAGGDPWGNDRLGFSATTKIERKDFGLTWNQALETGGVVVGDQIKITINTELMRPKA